MASGIKVSSVNWVLVCCVVLGSFAAICWYQDHQSLAKLGAENRELASGIAAMQSVLADQQKAVSTNDKNVTYDATAAVSADDLESGKAAVIGRFGVPLGTMMTLHGIWRDPVPKNGNLASKPHNLTFRVTRVNDNSLEEPIEFDGALIHVVYKRDQNDQSTEVPKPAVGEMWEIRAYETASFQSTPVAYDEEVGVSPDSPRGALPPWFRPFLVEIHGILQQPGRTGTDTEP